MTATTFVSRVTVLAFASMVAACAAGESAAPEAVLTPPAAPVASSIAISPSTLNVKALGSTNTLSVDARDESGRPVTAAVTWSSSDPSVASVSETGVVTSQSNGSTDITASYGSMNATARIVVAQEVASIAITPDTLSFQFINMAQDLTAVARDAGGRAIAGVPVVWSSSDPTVATVSSTGLVISLKAGKTTIRASTPVIIGSATVIVGAHGADGLSATPRR